MKTVLTTSEELIEKGSYAEALTILKDGASYEQWMSKYAAEITTGIAYCQLMDDQNTAKCRDTLAPLTEAQIKDMPEDSYWASLIYKVDDEIQRLESLAEVDEVESGLRQRLDENPENLDLYFELSELLIEKNRAEESIALLLDIMSIDRNWSEKKAHNKLMEVMKKLG